MCATLVYMRKISISRRIVAIVFFLLGLIVLKFALDAYPNPFDWSLFVSRVLPVVITGLLCIFISLATIAKKTWRDIFDFVTITWH